MKVKSKQLVAIFLEIMIVIVGISIAFALDNWASDKKEQKLERQFKTSLISDLNKDIQDLNEIIDSTQVIIGHVGQIFEYNYGGRADSLFRRHHIISTYLANYFYPQHGTYVSLVNSGEINVLGQFQLRKALSDHYNVTLKEVERTDDVIRNLADNVISRYILENIQFSFDRDGIVSADPLKTTKATNMIGSYFNLLSGRQQIYKDLINKSNSLIALINDTIE